MHKGLTSKTKDNHKSNMHHSKDSEVMLGYPAPQLTLSRTFLAFLYWLGIKDKLHMYFIFKKLSSERVGKNKAKDI